MPDGQKYEDWLKSKGSEEGGENSSPSVTALSTNFAETRLADVPSVKYS
jgi:hypothetical protein